MKKNEYLELLKTDATTSSDKEIDNFVIGALTEIFQKVDDVNIDGSKSSKDIVAAIESYMRSQKGAKRLFASSEEHDRVILAALGVKNGDVVEKPVQSTSSRISLEDLF